MTLPMRLRDTFAQRVLAYVAFCRLLSLEREKTIVSFFESTLRADNFEATEKLAAFSFKVDKFLRLHLFSPLQILFYLSNRDEFVGKEEKARRISSFSLTIRRFPRCESFERFENLHSRVGKTVLEAFHRSSYYLRAGLYLAIRGEDFTSVVALSNVVAPSKTVRANDELLVTRSMLLVRGMPPATSVTQRIGSK